MRMLRTSLGLFVILLLFATQALAKSTFLVVPFLVDGPQGFAYLERSVPQMLTSRLFWKDHIEPVSYQSLDNKLPAGDATAAEQARKAAHADYVIWGNVAIVGQDCTLDVRVRNKAGKTWRFTADSKANQFMTAIKAVSDRINKETFNRKTVAEPVVATGKTERVNQMNPNIVINETTPKDVYLNPHFRYAGGSGAGDETSLRSQALPFTAVGMEICDADGDGKNEVFLLDEWTLYAFRFENGRLEQKGEINLPRSHTALMIRSFTHNGRVKLLVNSIDQDTKPLSSVFSYSGGKFTEEVKGLRFFMNVVKLPPSYKPVLIGQAAQGPKLFRPNGVYEMNISGNSYTFGNHLKLPENVNLWNFTYLPGGFDDAGGDKLVTLTSREKLRIYTNKGSRLAETEESYSGSAKGFEIDPRMHGLGNDSVTLRDMYYIPMRMIAADLDHDGKYELLVNRPHSTAAKIFDRYRFFPQSEIHSMFWDGVGLNLQWKTRRIKGSTADIALADANNDGILDLAVLINTHPGAIGVKNRKTIVQLYPLDLSKVDPNTPEHSSFRSAD